MKTLRWRLLIYTAAATALILLAAGLAVFFLTRASLVSQFDAALLSAARALESTSEQNAAGVKVEAAITQFPEYSRTQSPDYFQNWLDDGAAVGKSASLKDTQLARPASVSDVPAYSFVILPDGQPGRQVAVRFVPPREDEEGASRHNYPPRAATLVVARHTAALDAGIRTLRWLLILVGLGATVAAGVTMYAAVSRGLRPLGLLAGRISQVRQSNLLEPIELAETPAELTVVVDRLNELLARLHEAISRERAFTADVAHELRTPLAGLEVTLEICSMKQRTAADYEARVGKSLSIVRDMRSMVENLLTLARADAGQLSVARTEIDLGPFIDECWEPFSARARERGVETSFDTHVSRIETDRDKLRIVLHNLMDNAVSYCDPAGKVAVSASEVDGSVEIRVRNSAGSINPDQIRNVFDRFWRGDAARTNAGVHCGLGLSLCRKIVDLLGGSIDVHATPDRLFEVRLRFPTPGQTHAAAPAGDEWRILL